MSGSLVTRFCLVLVVILGLAACQSSEERAEEHYQNALNLIEEGDFERAGVEFRNVFQNNGQHRDARARFAQLLRETDDMQGSYSQYLRLVEQYPGDVEGRIALAEMAIDLQNWEEARRHGIRARELASDDPRVMPIGINLDYADSIEAEDEPARRLVVDAARQYLDEAPENVSLRRIVIDAALRDGELEAALTEVDAALEIAPTDRQLYDGKLQILAQLERADEIEALLENMVDLFPEDEDLPGTLLRFYALQGDMEAAQSFLTNIVATTDSDLQRRSARSALVQLALQVDGPGAALAELDRIIAETDDDLSFRTLRAGIRFDQGEQSEAIADLETLLEGQESGEEVNVIRVTLARMLTTTGNVVGARALVEEILVADPSQADALKMKAAWLIEEDNGDEAIALLRTALDQDPNDSVALLLSADAHARNGDHSLAREFLSLAVDVSDAGLEESLRYARNLIGDERFLPAEEVLINALRASPGELQLLSELGQLYISMEDWQRAVQVENTLRNQDNEQATNIANVLQVRRLSAEDGMDDAIVFLEALDEEAQDGDFMARLTLIRAQLANGNADAAVALAEEVFNDDPENLERRYLLAATQAGAGQFDQARANYEIITTQVPEFEQAWIGLVRLLSRMGEREAINDTLQAALDVLPDGMNLLWAQASLFEQRANFEGAIAIYEQLYERAPNEPVIANNLASMISTYRDDDESLERAYAVARRLRGVEFAPYQDTYGWIAYRRGEYQEALDHLEPAAAALAEEPLVQFHLGMAYAAVERNEEALEQLRRAVELAGPEDGRTQFDTARAEIERLEAVENGAGSEGADQ
ncbi:tetratricopeptide repeat protein [Jannaschia sp. CCS1]|uniref:tetratricopeptide repeat protein n=1 Tax=Jannaschia sp. (strain CCS1) TaxID=290400 RepID=UPI000053ABA2|nr:tetratricopeptide repeat protein [Jannaschia sp. CCS1]ABD57152.1 Tetratricopeptide TPR_2 [Jannaschia sp. CCS1]